MKELSDKEKELLKKIEQSILSNLYMAKDGELVQWRGLPGTMFEGCHSATGEELREVVRGLNEYERKHPEIAAMIVSAIESNKFLSKEDKKRFIDQHIEFLQDETR